MMLYDPRKLARPEPIHFGGTVWNRLANNEDWVAQYKYDGARCMVEWSDSGARLWSRHGKEFSQQHAFELQDDTCPPGTIVEGELMKLRYFKAFDMLYYAGESLLSKRLRERLDKLEMMMPCAELMNVGPEEFWRAKEKGHEGLVLKNLNDVYPPGGGAKWLKVKS